MDKISLFSSDNFYFSIPKGIDPDDYDFDHPNSLDFDLMYKCLQELINDGETTLPVYSFIKHKSTGETNVLRAKNVIIFEGILSMHDERIRNMFDLKIFIHCDADIALSRRILRDIKERGRDINEVLKRYNTFIKQDYEKYVKPQMKYVDFIIPGGASNDIALNLISDNLQNLLNQKKRKKSFIVTIEEQISEMVQIKNFRSFSSELVLSMENKRRFLDSYLISIINSEDRKFIKDGLTYILKSQVQFVDKKIRNDLGLQDTNSPLYKQIFVNRKLCEGISSPKDSRLLVCLFLLPEKEDFEFFGKIRAANPKIPIYFSYLFSDYGQISKLLKKSEKLKIISPFILDSTENFFSCLQESENLALDELHKISLDDIVSLVKRTQL